MFKIPAEAWERESDGCVSNSNDLALIGYLQAVCAICAEIQDPDGAQHLRRKSNYLVTAILSNVFCTSCKLLT